MVDVQFVREVDAADAKRVEILVDGQLTSLVVSDGETADQEIARWVDSVYGETWPAVDAESTALKAAFDTDPSLWTNAQLRSALIALIRIELRKRRLV